MSDTAGGQPHPNPWTFEYFDSYRIADEVAWPLVDFIHDEEWLNMCELHDEFSLIKRDIVKMQLYHVIISGKNESNGAEEGETEYGIPTVTFRVESAVPEVGAGTIGTYNALDLAQEAAEEKADGGTLETVGWPKGDESKFRVRIGQEYTFEENGDLEKSAYRNVLGPRSSHRFPLAPSELESAAEEGNLLRADDMKNIEIACLVFNAPEAILAALDDIREAPLSID